MSRLGFSWDGLLENQFWMKMVDFRWLRSGDWLPGASIVIGLISVVVQVMNRYKPTFEDLSVFDECRGDSA